MCGDVNCDGAVDAVDALLIAQVGVGMRSALPCAVVNDVNSDGHGDIADALQIAQYAVGSRDGLMCSPVITSLAPATVGTAGGERVRVAGGNFQPGAIVIVGDNRINSTYVDCGTLQISMPPTRPGDLRVLIVNSDGGTAEAPQPLRVEGAYRDATEEANIDFVPLRGNDLLPVGGGIAVGDYDGDGAADIFVPNHAGPNALFQNRGNGTFDEVASAAGVDDPGGQGNGACFGDFDNDGDRDLYVTNLGPNRFFRNNGNRTFTDLAFAAGVDDDDRSTGCSWGDFDRDGFLDLYLANHLDESDPSVFVTRRFGPARRSDRLFHNQRNGTFADVTYLLGDADLVTGAGFGASFVDFDNDGDPDIYLINDFGREIQPNVLWRNDGPVSGGWRFTDVSVASGLDVDIFGMGVAIGDYDGNGFFDFYVSNIGRNVLMRARGDGTFEDRTDHAGVGRELIDGSFSVGWGNAFLDYDNDGDLDLYLVAGYLDSDPLVNQPEQPNALFRNRGNGTFEDVSPMSGADDDGIGRGLAVADFNRDGSLDLVFANLGQGVVLLENTGRESGHWLELDLRGTQSNLDAIGARVTAHVGARRLIREVAAGGSGMSQSDLTVHLGLGPTERIDALQIDWPSGTRQTLIGVEADRRLFVTEP